MIFSHILSISTVFYLLFSRFFPEIFMQFFDQIFFSRFASKRPHIFPHTKNQNIYATKKSPKVGTLKIPPCNSTHTKGGHRSHSDAPPSLTPLIDPMGPQGCLMGRCWQSNHPQLPSSADLDMKRVSSNPEGCLRTRDPQNPLPNNLLLRYFISSQQEQPTGGTL